MLAECFEELGGVPKVVLADRMGCLKGGVVANVVVPTPDYVRFATHYRFRPDFCEAADPESKGMVENLVGYAKDDLMVPLGTVRSTRGAGGIAGATPGRGVVRRGQRQPCIRRSAPCLRERLVTERELLAASAVAACGVRRRSRPPGRSTSSPASGSDRRATRSRTG